MSQKRIIFAAIIILAVIGGAFAYQYYRAPREESPRIVGGDSDEHGCIASAGYLWCEAKRKCARPFEEDCLSGQKIKAALALKYNKPVADVSISIQKENTQYARGSVSFVAKDLPPGGEGGMFLAAKINGEWKLVYDGNGSIDCAKIKKDYQFPQEMLAGFCD